MVRSKVLVQEQDFDITESVNWLRQGIAQVGAVATFLGTVRDFNEGSSVSCMTLEYYPGMTEKSLEKIIVTAEKRFEILSAMIIHRVGSLYPQDQIVFVGCTSQHREQAFLACQFIMDYLKTEAPFWKKEQTPVGAKWVSARDADDKAKEKWHQ